MDAPADLTSCFKLVWLVPPTEEVPLMMNDPKCFEFICSRLERKGIHLSFEDVGEIAGLIKDEILCWYALHGQEPCRGFYRLK